MNIDIKNRDSTQLILDVADIIEEEPDHFDMKGWFVPRPVEGEPSYKRVFYSAADGAPWEIAGRADEVLEHCGTTCCIAGWALAVTPVETVMEMMDTATEPLRATDAWTKIPAALMNIPSRAASELFTGAGMELHRDVLVRILREIAAIPQDLRRNPESPEWARIMDEIQSRDEDI